ncbi:MAG: cardiolipin synthase [Oscillospiraceae bacterium]|nr:cardiolipin synthase [Oscillospiraceae bacterium]
MRKLIKFLFSRNTLIVLLLLLQIAFLVSAVVLLSEHYLSVYLGLLLLDLVLVVYITNTSENPSYKLPWIMAMLVFPLFSGLAYILIKTDLGHRLFKKAYADKVQETRKYLPQDTHVLQQLRELDEGYHNLSNYLLQSGGYPVYRNCQAQYFSDGMEMFEAMKAEILAAKRYVFLEFFIISMGSMWDEILLLLQTKAEEGVDVRILYDGFGTQLQMPHHYFADLRKCGIQCRVFNGFKPLLSTSQNNRDHRKILVVDGHTAFTGGVNLADEYINRRERFGHWKDGGMLCRGEAAWSFTVMFLQLWELEQKDMGQLTKYRPDVLPPCNYDGYIQPYSDSPTDEEYVGKSVYLDIINNAKRYVYFMTPYLILDHEMITALGLAAKKGVDVRLILPHIPDKWYAHSTAWSYYRELLEAGVRIFEYTPGFIHAKNAASDDRIAVVGTINLDYRSLYLHFECAAVMYGSNIAAQIRNDFCQTLARSMEITVSDCQKRPLIKRIIGWILRIFAPLL